MPPTYFVKIERLVGSSPTDRQRFSDGLSGKPRLLPAFGLQPATASHPKGMRMSGASVEMATGEQMSATFSFSVEGLDPADVRRMVAGGIVQVMGGYDGNDGPPVGPLFYGHIHEVGYTTMAGKDTYTFSCIGGLNALYGLPVGLSNPGDLIIADAIRFVAERAGLEVGLMPPAAFGDFSGLQSRRGEFAVGEAGKNFAKTAVSFDGTVGEVLDDLVADIRRAVREATGQERNISIVHNPSSPFLIDVVDHDGPFLAVEKAFRVDVRSSLVISSGGPVYTAPSVPVDIEDDGGEDEVEEEAGFLPTGTESQGEHTVVMVFNPQVKHGMAIVADDKVLGVRTTFRATSIKHDLDKWRTEFSGPIIESGMRLSALSEQSGAEAA